MGIPVTAKCNAMQRGRIIRGTASRPSIAMTFTIVRESRPLAIIKPTSVRASEFRTVCAAMRAPTNARIRCTGENEHQQHTPHHLLPRLSSVRASKCRGGARTRPRRALTREFVFAVGRRFKNDLHSRSKLPPLRPLCCVKLRYPRFRIARVLFQRGISTARSGAFQVVPRHENT